MSKQGVNEPNLSETFLYEILFRIEFNNKLRCSMNMKFFLKLVETAIINKLKLIEKGNI